MCIHICIYIYIYIYIYICIHTYIAELIMEDLNPGVIMDEDNVAEEMEEELIETKKLELSATSTDNTKGEEKSVKFEESKSPQIIGYLLLITVNIFLYLCLFGWSIWKHI
jgi:hypothetical protein